VSKHKRTGGSVVYVLREKLASVGDDYWIEDESGNKAFRVDGKLIRVGNKAILEDSSGEPLFTIQHKLAHVHRTVDIERNGARVAQMRQNLVGLHHRYKIELEAGGEWHAKGDVLSWQFDIEGDEGPIAHASHKVVSIRDTFGIEIFDPPTAPLALAVMIGLEMQEKFDRG